MPLRFIVLNNNKIECKQKLDKKHNEQERRAGYLLLFAHGQNRYVLSEMYLCEEEQN